jgi:hypothetical protein
VKVLSSPKLSEWQGFNSEFEEMFRQQQQLVVSNKELKEELIKEIKQLTMPSYEAFLVR